MRLFPNTRSSRYRCLLVAKFVTLPPVSVSFAGPRVGTRGGHRRTGVRSRARGDRRQDRSATAVFPGASVRARGVSSAVLSVLAVVLLSASPQAQSVDTEVVRHAEQTPQPSAHAILERALERATTQAASGRELDFESVLESIFESLDGEGTVRETQTARYRRYPLEGLLYEEVIARDGQALDEEEAREEADRKADFVREARAHAARGEPYEPDDMSVRFDNELMDRYDTTFLGTEVVRDHACWVLGFAPRDGRLPDNRRMDKALNRSTGRVWIAQDDYGVASVSFEMQRPFRYVWGLVATLRYAAGRLDYERVDRNLWTPARFDLELDLRVFFKGIRRRIRQVWSEHSRIGEIARSS